MYPVASGHVVLVAWIWEIIHLYVIHDTLTNETETMLPKYHRVDRALTDH